MTGRLAEIEARVPFTDGGDVPWLLARVRELEAALREIAVVDAEEWHLGDGWRCVDYLQTKARAALNKEDA